MSNLIFPQVLVATVDGEFMFYDTGWTSMSNGQLVLFNKEVAHTVFPAGQWKSVSSYRTPVDAPEEDEKSEDLFDEIANFMKAGGQVVPETPEKEVSASVITYIDRVQEEVEETRDAWFVNRVPEAVDGFLDTAYVAITGAIRIAGVEKARECWEAIMRANTSKIDGTYGETITNPKTGKILKPKGWKAPDIKGILGRD